jgi:hypothetical protein
MSYGIIAAIVVVLVLLVVAALAWRHSLKKETYHSTPGSFWRRHLINMQNLVRSPVSNWLGQTRDRMAPIQRMRWLLYHNSTLTKNQSREVADALYERIQAGHTFDPRYFVHEDTLVNVLGREMRARGASLWL